MKRWERQKTRRQQLKEDVIFIPPNPGYSNTDVVVTGAFFLGGNMFLEDTGR